MALIITTAHLAVVAAGTAYSFTTLAVGEGNRAPPADPANGWTVTALLTPFNPVREIDDPPGGATGAVHVVDWQDGVEGDAVAYTVNEIGLFATPAGGAEYLAFYESEAAGAVFSKSAGSIILRRLRLTATGAQLANATFNVSLTAPAASTTVAGVSRRATNAQADAAQANAIDTATLSPLTWWRMFTGTRIVARLAALTGNNRLSYNSLKNLPGIPAAVTLATITGTLAIAKGGTGGTSAAAARQNLGAASAAALNGFAAAFLGFYLPGNDFNTLVAAGNTAPRGIWSDGSIMWVADWSDNKLYAYDLATKARSAGNDFNTLAAAGNTDPRDIWSDGSIMWVADAVDDKLYAYDLATKARSAGDDFNTLAAAGNTDPRGIWSDGSIMWVADAVDDKLFAYDLATKARSAGDDFNTLAAAGNTDPQGIWSDGSIMWVADLSDDKLFAYDMATKARSPGDAFNTLVAAGNTSPQGIWSDGSIMWVADEDANSSKIHAYFAGME